MIIIPSKKKIRLHAHPFVADLRAWLANYTNGYEGWSIVRDTGYPTACVITSDNNDIISFGGENNGLQIHRLKYGTGTYTSNGDNVNAAVSAQGPDKMTTKLWFAK